MPRAATKRVVKPVNRYVPAEKEAVDDFDASTDDDTMSMDLSSSEEDVPTKEDIKFIVKKSKRGPPSEDSSSEDEEDEAEFTDSEECSSGDEVSSDEEVSSSDEVASDDEISSSDEEVSKGKISKREVPKGYRPPIKNIRLGRKEPPKRKISAPTKKQCFCKQCGRPQIEQSDDDTSDSDYTEDSDMQ